MRQSRKETAWKKSRKFGDVKGGRTRPKLADNIFRQEHSLVVPAQGEERPIFLEDNPSRDFYFPISIPEIKVFLAQLPKSLSKQITHIWLKKVRKKDYYAEGTQGCFITGGGVRLIVIYPFPRDLIMPMGDKKPTKKILKWYKRYGPVLKQAGRQWELHWTAEGIKQYYLEGLLLHEIGHQIDSQHQRYWSKTYHRKAEKFADNFAYYWGGWIRREVE